MKQFPLVDTVQYDSNIKESDDNEEMYDDSSKDKVTTNTNDNNSQDIELNEKQSIMGLQNQLITTKALQGLSLKRIA